MSSTRTLVIVALAAIAVIAAYLIYEENRSGVEINAPGVKIDTK